jgi:hypothetical protein
MRVLTTPLPVLTLWWQRFLGKNREPTLNDLLYGGDTTMTIIDYRNGSNNINSNIYTIIGDIISNVINNAANNASLIFNNAIGILKSINNMVNKAKANDNDNIANNDDNTDNDNDDENDDNTDNDNDDENDDNTDNDNDDENDDNTDDDDNNDDEKEMSPAYQYGLLKPITNTDHVLDQMKRAHDFKKELTEIECVFRKVIREEFKKDFTEKEKAFPRFLPTMIFKNDNDNDDDNDEENAHDWIRRFRRIRSQQQQQQQQQRTISND